VLETNETPLHRKFVTQNEMKTPDKPLTKEQVAALEAIEASSKPVLLAGVTGSGKTEIYLRQILKTVAAGQQSILLVPEIALTPQMIAYFKDYLKGHIAVFHSKLSEGEKAREWWKVKTGEAVLVIGSRSSIFAPVQDLGLVILDEEHEWTYKQESTPYYQTHRVAEAMQEVWGARVILGSATPSADSFYRVGQGDFVEVRMPTRINQLSPPVISVVDLRDEFKKRNFSVLSLKLQLKIKERLARGEQIILFVNQRGFANAVVCRDCGYTERCPDCEISLKLHSGLRLICHYCHFEKRTVITCPDCQSAYIKNIGVGTQRVEEEVLKLFSQARVLRADKDTTQSKGGFETIYNEFLEGRHDVLIGTQMIAKGLDFKNVTLIGIILADIGLHMPDFRSSERLFQIITQVAGRCGRGDQPGEVILQTYNPTHPTIKRAANYEYEAFIQKELADREALNYPPYNRMIKFTIVGQDEKKLMDHVNQEQEILEDIFMANKLPVKIVSAPALIPKMAGRYYYHVLLRAKDPSIVFNHWEPPRGWRVDVDPIHTT